MKFIVHSIVVSVAAVSLHSCGMNAGSDYAMASPEVSAANSNSGLRSGDFAITRGSIHKQSGTAQRQLVKSGRMHVDVADIGTAADRVESTVKSKGGYMTSMSESRDDGQRAAYQIRIPSKQLKSTMLAFEELGDVTVNRVSVDDVTAQKVRYQARLKELNARQGRILAMLHSAKTVKEKLEVERLLAELEAEIFKLEVAAKEQAKHAAYSKLALNLSRKSIDGPVGAAWKVLSWSAGKLFTIRG
jgi:hypothetical protein